MAVSIIVPIHKEKELSTFLKQFLSLEGKFEIIIISTQPLHIADDFINKLDIKIEVSNKGRAIQMNKGAKISTYENLWFLHFDSIIDKNSINQIENSLNKHCVGCFKLKFNSKSLLLKICAFLSNLRVKYKNIAFGDQGIFIKKEFFNKLKAYREVPIMEDYDLSIKVSNENIKFKQLKQTIITSDRKFEKHFFKTVFTMQLLQLKFRLNYDIKNIAKQYDKLV